MAIDNDARGLAGAALGAVNPLSASLARVPGDGIAQPATNLNASAGAAGALTGTYYYTQTFVTNLGETSPWTGTATPVVLSSQRASLNNIPIGPSGVIARKIYRTKATSPDPKDYWLVTTVNDNTTTTFIDNTPDASLTVPANWADTNRGRIVDLSGNVVSTWSATGAQLGYNRPDGGLGYASVAIGGALTSATSAKRNVAIGAYALSSVTNKDENTGLGVHAGQGPTGTGNTVLGCYAMMTPGAGGTQSFNTVIGHSAGNASLVAAGYGSVCTLIGYKAGYNINTADNVVALGGYAGNWANASGQVFIDNRDRGSISGCQNVGLIYGKTVAGTTASVAIQQELRFNALTRVGPAGVTVSNLPTASPTWLGFRAFVFDNTTAFSSSLIGTAPAGGGSHGVPVICVTTGTGSTYAWVIG